MSVCFLRVCLSNSAAPIGHIVNSKVLEKVGAGNDFR